MHLSKDRSLKDLEAELTQSVILREILLLLQKNPETFNTLLGYLRVQHARAKKKGVSSRTLSKHLKRAKKDGLVKHKRRNTPYRITQKGSDWLGMSKTIPTQEFAIDYVKSGSFTGSIIFRVPKKFVDVFNKLYTPGPLEGLRRVFMVAFGFWVNRYGCNVVSGSKVQKVQKVGGGTIAYGKDFNNDKIWDLTMLETPASGYANIKKALKKGEFTLNGNRMRISSVNLWAWALDALEDQLSNAQYSY